MLGTPSARPIDATRRARGAFVILLLLAPFLQMQQARAVLGPREYNHKDRASDKTVTSSANDYPLFTDIVGKSSTGHSYATFDVPPTETRHVRAHIETKVSRTISALAGYAFDISAQILCNDVTTGTAVQSALTERNHEGSNHAAGYDSGSTSVGYAATGVLAYDLNLLVVAPAGALGNTTFECDLQARWRLGNDDGTDWVKYLGVDTNADPHSWLEWSKPYALDGTNSTADTGNRWFDMKAASTCSPVDDPTCKYLVPGAAGGYPSEIRIFGTGFNPEGKRSAHALATSVTAIGVVGITSCPVSASCRSDVNDLAYYSPTEHYDDAVVDTRVAMYQLDINGNTDASGTGLCPNHVLPSLRRNTITRLTHHFMSTHTQPITLSTAPGCAPRVLAFIYVRAYRDAPVKIDPGNMTHLILLNNG